MKVLDLSTYQKNIDFDKIVKEGIEGVILRCIVKDGRTDSCFEKFYEKAVSRGLKVGCYTFSYDLSADSATSRALATVKAMKGAAFDLGFWLDLEWSTQRSYCDSALLLDIINEYKRVITNAGYKFGIYCNQDWYKHTIPQVAKNNPFWIARYPYGDSILQPSFTPLDTYKPTYCTTLYGWQYSSHVSIGGYNVDCSMWYADGTSKTYTPDTIGLQQYLNDNYDTNLVVDGKLGKKTYKAILDNLK